MAARFDIALAFLAVCATPAAASEKIDYTYDARGRLTKTTVTGGVNNGQTRTTVYDKADNRTNYSVQIPPMMFFVGNTSATEGALLKFTVKRQGTLASTASVSWSITGGTATPGADYLTSSGTLNFAIGQAGATFDIATINDALPESAETVAVTLSNPVGAGIQSGTSIGTINDND